MSNEAGVISEVVEWPGRGRDPAFKELLFTLMDSLERRQLAHCYWKCSLHLDRALRGGTKDFDLLVAHSQRAQVSTLLGELGFKHLCLPPARRLEQVEHWLGFDRDSGELLHLHLHDNAGTNDEHLPIGEGNIDFTSLMALVGDAAAPPSATLEAHSFAHLRRSHRKLNALLESVTT